MITQFKDEFSFLSNFHSVQVKFEGMIFPSVEHAYQAAKTLDLIERRKIAMLPSPGKAKRYGRELRIRNDWETIKIPIMEFLLRQKFGKNSIFRKLLMYTYPEQLIEGNDWGDRFWGMEFHDGDWIGENNLGRLLMKVRQECLWDCSNPFRLPKL